MRNRVHDLRNRVHDLLNRSHDLLNRGENSFDQIVDLLNRSAYQLKEHVLPYPN